MYRFNGDVTYYIVYRSGFKYNPCIGSISMFEMLAAMEAIFKYNPCIGSIMFKV